MRRGLTFIELLIVLAIVGILVALMLPAVQASREASRRIGCSSKLKQIVIAVHLYESSNRMLPPQSSGSKGFFQILLPYLEQGGNSVDGDGAFFSQPGSTVSRPRSIPFYRCPSDGSSHVIFEGRGGSNY